MHAVLPSYVLRLLCFYGGGIEGNGVASEGSLIHAITKKLKAFSLIKLDFSERSISRIEKSIFVKRLNLSLV